MARRNVSTINSAEHEQGSLQRSLHNTAPQDATENTLAVAVEDAVRGAAIYEDTSARDKTRVLFITRDDRVLNHAGPEFRDYLALAARFAEVHIVVLRAGIRSKRPVMRASDNVWLYIADAKHWWLTPWQARALVKSQLMFAGGFRPDLIVARDPFESALAALLIRRRYDRSLQLHVLEPYTGEKFRDRQPGNRWRQYLAKFMLGRFASVRVASEALRTQLASHYDIVDLAVLPQYQDYQDFLDAESSLDIKADKYRQFVFVILCVAQLNDANHVYQVIDASRYILRNKRIGLVIIGKGQMQARLRERAKLFNIEEQVVFESEVSDLAGYFLSADVLITAGTDAYADQVVVQGAAAGIPVVATKTPLREHLFTAGETALLCEPDDTACLQKQLGIVLNNNTMRKRLRMAASDAVRRTLQGDPVTYRRQLHDSIEAAIFVDASNAPSASQQKKAQPPAQKTATEAQADDAGGNSENDRAAG